MLKISNLHVRLEEEEKQILKGVDLTVGDGQVHAIMGPNGSGKSTLSYVLSGKDGYEITQGSADLDGIDLLALDPEERASAGLFLAFQYPVEIPGVSIANFLRTAKQAHLPEGEEIDLFDFQDELLDRMKLLDMDPTFAERPVNDGFSGGEKKRNEILQMAMLKPTMAVMDETDSGLDIDALQIVAQGVNALTEENPQMSVLLITHYQRLLNYIKPDVVHVMVDGRIVKTGGPEIALELEEEGYADFREFEPA